MSVLYPETVRWPAASDESRWAPRPDRSAATILGLPLVDATEDAQCESECRQLAASASRGRRFGVMLCVGDRGRLARLVWFMMLRLRNRWAERLLLRAGARPIGRFAVYPNVYNPAITYELETPAATYAEAQLLHSHGRGLRYFVSKVVRAMGGCDAAAAAIIVVGEKL